MGILKALLLRIVWGAPFALGACGGAIDVFVPSAPWAETALQRRQYLVFENAASASNLAGLTVRVLLTPANFDYSKAASNGSDLRFYFSDGTRMSYEIQRWSVGGTSVVWLKVPVVYAGSGYGFAYMYYGGTPTSAAPASPTDAWAAPYAGVWHLAQDPAPFTDSTPNAKSLSTDTGTSSAAGFFDLGRQFNGSSHYLSSATYSAALDITGGVTLMAWVKPTVSCSDMKIIANQSGADGGYKLGCQGGKFEMEIRDSSNTSAINRTAPGGTGIVAGNWYHVAGTYSQADGTLITYVNGTLDRLGTTSYILGTSPGPVIIGREPFAGSAHWGGVIHGLRVLNVAASADWVRAEYLSQIGVFTRIGPIENVPQ